MRLCLFVFVFGASTLLAGAFSLEVDVSAGDSISRVDGLEGDYTPPPTPTPTPVPTPEPTPTPPPSPISFVGPNAGPSADAVNSATPVAVLSLPLSVSMDSKEEPEGVSVQFSSAKTLAVSSVSQPSVAPVGALPPLVEGENLPLPGGESAGGDLTSSVLVSRDGEMLSGREDMVDYLTSRALPAQAVNTVASNPVVADPVSTEDFLGTLGSPSGSDSGLDPRRVDTDVVGEMQVGTAFGSKDVRAGGVFQGHPLFSRFLLRLILPARRLRLVRVLKRLLPPLLGFLSRVVSLRLLCLIPGARLLLSCRVLRGTRPLSRFLPVRSGSALCFCHGSKLLPEAFCVDD